MPRMIHPEDGRVYACPECDGAPIYERTGTNVSIGKGDAVACYDCSATFDRDAVVDRSDNSPGTGSKLEQMMDGDR